MADATLKFPVGKVGAFTEASGVPVLPNSTLGCGYASEDEAQKLNINTFPGFDLVTFNHEVRRRRRPVVGDVVRLDWPRLALHLVEVVLTLRVEKTLLCASKF